MCVCVYVRGTSGPGIKDKRTASDEVRCLFIVRRHDVRSWMMDGSLAVLVIMVAPVHCLAE